LGIATPETAAVARAFVQQHAPASIAEAAVLAASELVGNVARHAPGPARLVLTIRASVIVLSVSDAHPEIPVMLPAPDASDVEWPLDTEGGRGLAIICAMGAVLAARRVAGRKRVTARFSIGGTDA
jgi:anti-sigma regulatory factor (Ser/Thr protein kinase)